MAAARPEKATVRGLWVEEVRAARDATPPEVVPLYVTLPGAEGGDIQALIDAGIIGLEENGAIAAEDGLRIVAVENSPGAVIQLQSRFFGLKILEEPLHSLLHSTSPVAWPVGEHRRFFRGQVVNLDLDGPLGAEVESGQLAFPVLALIKKLSTLHAQPPHIEWSLCLTLHGDFDWTPEAERLALTFLKANLERDAAFSTAAETALGGSLHQALLNPDTLSAQELTPEDKQRLLMVLVPKRIAFDVHRDGWSVETTENIRYGGTEHRAPMVTWIMRFRWDVRTSTHPEIVYGEALAGVLRRCGQIDADGNLTRAA